MDVNVFDGALQRLARIGEEVGARAEILDALHHPNAMLTASLQDSYARGLPLSLLFPYSIPFYNRLGYGVVTHTWCGSRTAAYNAPSG